MQKKAYMKTKKAEWWAKKTPEQQKAIHAKWNNDYKARYPLRCAILQRERKKRFNASEKGKKYNRERAKALYWKKKGDKAL